MSPTHVDDPSPCRCTAPYENVWYQSLLDCLQSLDEMRACDGRCLSISYDVSRKCWIAIDLQNEVLLVDPILRFFHRSRIANLRKAYTGSVDFVEDLMNSTTGANEPITIFAMNDAMLDTPYAFICESDLQRLHQKQLVVRNDAMRRAASAFEKLAGLLELRWDRLRARHDNRQRQQAKGETTNDNRYNRLLSKGLEQHVHDHILHASVWMGCCSDSIMHDAHNMRPDCGQQIVSSDLKGSHAWTMLAHRCAGDGRRAPRGSRKVSGPCMPPHPPTHTHTQKTAIPRCRRKT